MQTTAAIVAARFPPQDAHPALDVENCSSNQKPREDEAVLSAWGDGEREHYYGCGADNVTKWWIDNLSARGQHNFFSLPCCDSRVALYPPQGKEKDKEYAEGGFPKIWHNTIG
mmetsp:Transcript_9537/g.18298  ORF Transcript_9537/g.18298 Transcript_9537/m.18298 type:complete len:113 (+) Transcript_9537:259-597(+)